MSTSTLPIGLDHLRLYLLPGAVGEAEEHLYKLLDTASLLHVGCRYFRSRIPKAWARNQGKLLPAPGRPYSELERKVLEWMEELFGFNRDYVEDVAQDGERMPYIPLYDIGIDLEDLFERGADMEYAQGWRLLAMLDQNRVPRVTPEEEDEYGLDPRVVNALFDALGYTSESWSWRRLDDVCRQAPWPLHHLALAIRMIDRQTGNLFLDPSPEMPVTDAGHNLKDVSLLVRHWRQAHRMRQQADQLAGWIEAHPAHFRKVVDLWNQAVSISIEQ